MSFVKLWIDLIHYKYPSIPHFLYISESWDLKVGLLGCWMTSLIFGRTIWEKSFTSKEVNLGTKSVPSSEKWFPPSILSTSSIVCGRVLYEANCGRPVPLPILMELEPGIMDSVKSGPYGTIFGQTENLIFGILWMPTSTQGIRYLIWNMKYGYDQ